MNIEVDNILFYIVMRMGFKKVADTFLHWSHNNKKVTRFDANSTAIPCCEHFCQLLLIVQRWDYRRAALKHNTPGWVFHTVHARGYFQAQHLCLGAP